MRFDSVTVGSFVQFQGNDTLYTVTRVYKEPIGNPLACAGKPVYEHFLELKPSLDMGSYTRIVGHMDTDAKRLRMVSRAPAEFVAFMEKEQEEKK